MAMEPKPGRFVISAEAEALLKRLRETGGQGPGTKVSYGELSQLIDLDVQSDKGRGYLGTARRHAQKQDGLVFKTIPREGLLCLSAFGIVELTEWRQRGIRRATKRAVDSLQCADTDKMSRPEKDLFNLRATSLALIYHVTKPSVQKQLAAPVTQAGIRLPTQKTLEALRAP